MKPEEEAHKCPLRNPAVTGSRAVTTEGTDVVLEIKSLCHPGLSFDP